MRRHKYIIDEMEKKLNEFCNQLLKENSSLFSTPNFHQAERYKNETLPLIVNQYIEYMQQSPSKTLNVIMSRLFTIATSKNFTSTINLNHFFFFCQILDRCFCMLNFGNEERENIGIAEATQMVGIVFLPNIPEQAIPFLENIFSILAKRENSIFHIFITNILNDPKSNISHIILKAMVTDYNTMTSFLEVADNLFSSVPKKLRLQYCQTLEELIITSVTNDPESFGQEIPGAEKLFDKIEDWGPPYWSAAVALLFLIPSKASKSSVSNLFSQIQNFSSSFSTSLQGMMMLLPAIICLSGVQNKAEYHPLAALFLPIIVHYVRQQINNLLQLPFAEDLMQSLPIILAKDYPQLMSEVILISINGNIPEINAKLPTLFAKLASDGRANDMVHPLEIILNRSFQNRDHLAAKIFIKADKVIPPFISDPDRSLLLSQYLEATEESKLIDIATKILPTCDNSILNGGVVILDYATMVVKSRLLDGNEFAKHMVLLACSFSTFAKQIKDLDTKTFNQYKSDLEIIGILALPSTSPQICQAAFQLLSSVDEIISYKYETSFSELKKASEAHKAYSVTNQVIRTALLSVCYCSDSITEALTILLLHLKKIANSPDLSLEEFANTATVLLTFPTPIVDTILATMVPMISENTPAAKRLATIISASMQRTAVPFLVLNLYSQALEIGHTPSPAHVPFITNTLFILSRAAEQQRWHQALSTIPDFSPLAELLLQYADASMDTELMFSTCHLFLHTPAMTAESVREEFCATAARWANRFLLACAADPASDAGACVTLSAMIAVADALEMRSEHTLALCANAAWRAVNMSTAASSIGTRLLAVLARTNGRIAPLLAARAAANNRVTAESFCMALAEAVPRIELAPKSMSELVLEDAFLESACENVSSSSSELYSNLMIESALALGREHELMGKLAHIELRGISQQTLNTAFRQNGIASRAVSNFTRLAAPHWATHFFAPAVFDLIDMDDAGEVFEINPQRGATSPENFLVLLEALTKSAVASLDAVPEPINRFLMQLYEITKEKMGEYAVTVISGLFFLRVALPMLTAPDNMCLGIPLSAAVRDALINASVVLMGAVNKGDLTEKRAYFHTFNEFAGRAQKELLGALLRVLEGRARTVPGERLSYSVSLLERPILSLLVSTSTEIMPALDRLEETKELRERVLEVMVAPPGVFTRPQPSHVKGCSGAALAALEAPLSAREMDNAGRAVVRIGQNMLVVVPSRMAPQTPRMALTQQILVHIIDTKADFSIVVDGSDWEFSEAEVITEIFSGLPTYVQERVKEVVIAGASPSSIRTIQRISELPLSKLITFADKIPEFQMKYGNALPLFRRRLRMTFGSCVSTKALFEGATVILKLYEYVLDIASGLGHVQVDLSDAIHINHAHRTLRIVIPEKIYEFGHVDDMSFVHAVKEAAIGSAPVKKWKPSDPIADLFALGALCAAQGGDGSVLLKALLDLHSGQEIPKEPIEKEKKGIKKMESYSSFFDLAAEEFAKVFGERECAVAVDACVGKALAFGGMTAARMVERVKSAIDGARGDPIAVRALLYLRSRGGKKAAAVIDEILAETPGEAVPALLELAAEQKGRSFSLLEECARRNSVETADGLLKMLPAATAIDGIAYLIDCGLFDRSADARLLSRLVAAHAVDVDRSKSLHALLGRLVALLGGVSTGLEPLREAGEGREAAKQRLCRGIGAVLARTRESAPELKEELKEELRSIDTFRARLALSAIDELDSMLDK